MFVFEASRSASSACAPRQASDERVLGTCTWVYLEEGRFFRPTKPFDEPPKIFLTLSIADTQKKKFTIDNDRKQQPNNARSHYALPTHAVILPPPATPPKQDTMAPEKRNKFLDPDESDDDDGAQSSGYDSEAEVQKGGRGSKRRKLEDASGSSDDDSDHDSDAASDAGDDDDAPGDADEDTPAAKDGGAKPKKKLPAVKTSDPLRSLVKKNLVVSEPAIKKSGVLYISRVPPFMKPHKLRTLLEPFGTINKTYLAPEDPTSHARRVRSGGNKKRLFTEGWAEFVDKRDAKKAYELLNARTIGGKKGSYYRDDVWSLVYLKGFKWRDLTAQIEKENAEREGRMRAEIRKATRENLEFTRNVERAKELDGMKAKRERQGREEKPAEKGAEKARVFKQTQKVVKGGEGAQPDNVKRVLSKIF